MASPSVILPQCDRWLERSPRAEAAFLSCLGARCDVGTSLAGLMLSSPSIYIHQLEITTSRKCQSGGCGVMVSSERIPVTPEN